MSVSLDSRWQCGIGMAVDLSGRGGHFRLAPNARNHLAPTPPVTVAAAHHTFGSATLETPLRESGAGQGGIPPNHGCPPNHCVVWGTGPAEVPEGEQPGPNWDWDYVPAMWSSPDPVPLTLQLPPPRLPFSGHRPPVDPRPLRSVAIPPRTLGRAGNGSVAPASSSATTTTEAEDDPTPTADPPSPTLIYGALAGGAPGCGAAGAPPLPLPWGWHGDSGPKGPGPRKGFRMGGVPFPTACGSGRATDQQSLIKQLPSPTAIVGRGDLMRLAWSSDPGPCFERSVVHLTC